MIADSWQRRYDARLAKTMPAEVMARIKAARTGTEGEAVA
jgi:hypothetical protein